MLEIITGAGLLGSILFIGTVWVLVVGEFLSKTYDMKPISDARAGAFCIFMVVLVFIMFSWIIGKIVLMP